MRPSVFKIKSEKGRWLVVPPLNLKEIFDLPFVNSKLQAIDAAREAAMPSAPAIIEVFTEDGTVAERIFID